MLLGITNLILGILTILGQIFFLIYLAYFLITPAKTNNFSQQGIKFAFIVALVASSGSLFYSNIIGFAPCDLCWLAVIKKDTKIIDYSLFLTFIGAAISLYHNYIYYISSSISVCGINGISCTIRYVLEFGYITIPIMALTAFLIIIILLINQKKYE